MNLGEDMARPLLDTQSLSKTYKDKNLCRYIQNMSVKTRWKIVHTRPRCIRIINFLSRVLNLGN